MCDIIQKNDSKECGLYIHIPFCRSRCSYCGFVSCTDCDLADKYVTALNNEISERVRGKKIDTVYVGGGTPSVLPRGALSKIFDNIYNCAQVEKGCEISCEANPDSFTGGFISEAASCGVNRISLGVQSLNDVALKAVGRRHDRVTALKAVRSAVKQFDSVSCDLMIGLPQLNKDDVLSSVKTLCDEGIKHISVYSLSVEENTPLYYSGYKPNEDACADVYESVYKMLRSRGFCRYEVSNFALPQSECRHNIKYWNLSPYIGVGAAAHSYYNGRRYCNTNDINSYINGNRGESYCVVDRAALLEEYIMLGLRTERGLSINKLNELSSTDWCKSHSGELEFLYKNGLLSATDEGFKLTERAFYVMNDIIIRLI